jgi:hypothetical protein
MTPRQLHRAVARATGESVSFIARRGFSLLAAPPTRRQVLHRPRSTRPAFSTVRSALA